MQSVVNLRTFLNSNQATSPFAVVLGRPVAHSLSPMIHNAAFGYHGINVHYYPVLVEENEEVLLSELFQNDNFTGANITIPLKSNVIDYLSKIDDDVLETGACNTVYLDTAGVVCGANTDISGFIEPLIVHKDKLAGRDAIVFGTGGASRAVVFGLNKLGVRNITMVSRNSSAIPMKGVFSMANYENWIDNIPGTEILVNCTPLGMHPDVDTSPVSDKNIRFLKSKICYDIVYRPQVTTFLKQAVSQGAMAINGLPMFTGQAAHAFQYFTGKPFPVELISSLLEKQLGQYA